MAQIGPTRYSCDGPACHDRAAWIVKVIIASDEIGRQRKEFHLYEVNPSRERLAVADPRKRHACSYHCASLMLAEFMNANGAKC